MTNLLKTLVSSALLALSLAACKTGIASVTVAPGSASLTVGTTQAFTAVARDSASNVVPATFGWISSNPAIATVDASTGVATGVSSGNADITATAEGISGSASLTVTSLSGAGATWDSSTWDAGIWQ